MSRSRRDGLVVATMAILLTVTGCGTAGSFVWMRDYGAPPAEPAKPVVGRGDLISVQVWNAEQMATKQRVRDDGTVSLFFMDDLPIAGLTATEIARTIAARLDGILVSPHVTVVLEEAASSTISIVGEVTRPGLYPIRSNPTLLEAIGMAAGLTDYARRDRIYVLRSTPDALRLRVTYEELIRGSGAAARFRLRAGDVVVVE